MMRISAFFVSFVLTPMNARKKSNTHETFVCIYIVMFIFIEISDDVASMRIGILPNHTHCRSSMHSCGASCDAAVISFHIHTHLCTVHVVDRESVAV